MSKDHTRSDRVAEQIRRELSDLLMFELKDPRVRLVTLTDVELTPDFAHAKVFYTSLADESGRQAIARGLTNSVGFLRRELGRRVRIHQIPELHFHYDHSVERGAHLSRLIDEVIQADVARGEAVVGDGSDNDHPTDDTPPSVNQS